MSLIRVITRIYPLNVVPDGLSKLVSPKEFGNPSRVEMCCITDPRNGLQYAVETAFFSEKLDISEDIDKEISLECEKFPGLISAPENSRLLSPYEYSKEFSEDYAALCVPKRIHRDEVPHLLNFVMNEKSNELNERSSAESEKCPSLKIRFNLKKIKEECADHHASKKAREKLLRPLLRYFIDNECLICGFIASKATKQGSIKHLVSHIDGNCYRCGCCSIPFSSPEALYLHNIKDAKQKPYSCDVCNKKYRRKHSLTVHKLKEHDLSLLFPKDSSKDQLVLKQKIIPLFICSICHEKLISWNSLVNHKKIHGGKENYQCLFCGKLFTNTCLLRYHTHIRIIAHSHVCKICCKRFTSYGKLQRHRKLHVKKAYVCQVCGKKFYFPFNFLKHIQLLHETN